MYRQHYLPTTGRTAGAATRRPLVRCLLLAVAACVLGLLPGIPSLAPAGPAVVQAAQPDQPHAAAPAGGLASAVQPTSSGPKDYPPNLIVQSTGARDEQLGVAAALDQGTRLFLLQARYQDAGNGQADYYLAGPQGVSRQPLRELFAPLREWLAAPGHEHEMVMLGLRTDPRSANPARFDAACQAFTSALGRYLLKSSDLPAGKSLDELTPDEQAALQSRPRVVTDWSACAGEAPPIRRPPAHPAAAVPVKDHWMADQKDIIGQRPLRQVVIPGSHDAATYEDPSCPAGECWPWGPIEAAYAQAQSQDVTAQLQAGSRYLDLRFTYWDGEAGKDFFVFHGTAPIGNDPDPNPSYLRMGKVLYDILVWINQPGHEREIVWLDMDLYREWRGPSLSKAICDATLGWELAQGKVLQSSMLPPYTALTDMSMNEIWTLPGHPQIIVTGWSSCTGDNPMTKGGTWAGRCWGQNIWDKLFPELIARTDSNRSLVMGAYALDIQATPFSSDICVGWIRFLAPQQNVPLTMISRLVYLTDPNDMRARANLNVVGGDYLGDPAGEGPSNWPIVWTALYLNEWSFPTAVVLSWTQEPGASVTVSCNTQSLGATMVVYPVVQGPQSPNLKTFTNSWGSPGVQGSVSRSDFPGAGAAADGSYLVAACALGGSPLDPPGSSSAEISRIVIPLSPFVPLPVLSATPADPVDLPFTCSYPGVQEIQVTAYPAADPLSPDAQVFSANGSTVQATYSRRGSYDVRLDCATGNELKSLMVPDSTFPPALTIRADQKDRWLYCDRALQVGLFTLSLAALTPNAPTPLSATGSSDKDKTVVLRVQPDWFPPGDYLLTATCASNRQKLPWTATPLTLSSSQIPHREVTAEITGCSAQGGNAYACALQVTLGTPLAVNTVFHVGIRYLGSGGGGFANPSGGDRPQVTAIQGCQAPPLPSPYLVDGNGSYTRYDVNIGPGGCTAGAVMSFGEAVTGVGAAPITQQVTVPGLGAITTVPVLLP
jgi:hypothetical protein